MEKEKGPQIFELLASRDFSCKLDKKKTLKLFKYVCYE